MVLWHGLSGERVRAVEWSPAEDGVLAYGTEKGAVGCLRLTPDRAGRVGGGHEKGPVHSLTWIFDGAKVLSCGGDGRALLFESLEGSKAEPAEPVVRLLPHPPPGSGGGGLSLP